MTNEFVQRSDVGIEMRSIKEIKDMILSPNVALVNDFDETIASTVHFQRESYTNSVKKVLGIDFIITEEFGRTQLRGRSGLEICRILFRHFGNVEDETLVAQAVGLRRDVLERLVNEEANLTKYLMPGIDEMVRMLRSLGKKAGIASQSPDGFIHAFLQRAEVDGKSIEDIFPKDAVVGETTVQGIETALSLVSQPVDNSLLYKPVPFPIYLAAARVQHREGDHILYVGDHNVDAQCVIGKKNMTGLIVNKDEGKRNELCLMYGQQGNIVTVGSLREVLI